ETPPRRDFLHLAAGAAALSALPRVAGAEAYPARTVTIIVPVAAGGTLSGRRGYPGGQIEQKLPQPHGGDSEGTQLLLCFDQQTGLFLLGELARGADHLIDQRSELHRLVGEVQPSCLDLGKVEHLVNEAEQVGAGAMHALKRLLRPNMSVSPMMVLSGVRSSWLTLDTNCDLCSLASASWRLFSSISLNRRAFWIASTDCRRRFAAVQPCLGNLPGCFRRIDPRCP